MTPRQEPCQESSSVPASGQRLEGELLRHYLQDTKAELEVNLTSPQHGTLAAKSEKKEASLIGRFIMVPPGLISNLRCRLAFLNGLLCVGPP
jgi:hypothetical protein